MNIEKDIIENPDKYATRNKRAIIAFYVVYFVISTMIFARAADEVSKPFGRIEGGSGIFVFIIITLVWALGYVLGTCAIAYTVKNLRDSITQKKHTEKDDENVDEIGEIHSVIRGVSKVLYALACFALFIGFIMCFMLLFLKEIILTPEAADVFKSVMNIGTAAGAILMFVSVAFIVIVKKYRQLLFGLSFVLSSSALYFFLAIRGVLTQMYGNDNLRITIALVAGVIVIVLNVLYAKKRDKKKTVR